MPCLINMAKRKPTKKEKLVQRMTLERILGIRPPDYSGPLPRPKCNCNNFGCWGCMNYFKWSQQARWTKIINPCAEIVLPSTPRMPNLTMSMFSGELGSIDSFRFIRTNYANDTTTLRSDGSS
jgi:hypothetical protein